MAGPSRWRMLGVVALLASGLVSGLSSGLVPTVGTPAGAVAGPSASVGTAAAPTSAISGKRVIGRSVQGRPIVAYRLGQPGKSVALLVSTMHGNEADTRQILSSLVNGAPVRGLDLWVVPTYNPDGMAAGRRQNAHGVDLNRNYPYRWADLDGSYESGRRAGSEPETQAMMAFVKAVRPRWILGFHQPLHGVDVDTKSPTLARRVAWELRLPKKRFDCGGVCHGTMTGWFNRYFEGSALTVEYGAAPSRELMRDVAPDQVLRVWKASRG